jgi:protein-disulfide isomerase
MENSKKPFFDLLHPKQAFILGCVSTVLVMGTVGFMALGVYVVGGGAAGGFDGVGSLAEIGTQGQKVEAGSAADVPSNAAQAAAAAEDVVGEVPVVTAADHVFGDPKAPVTIIEYSDFQCPFCSRFHPIMKQVMETYAGKVKWVYRHFPLSFHPHAEPAAEAAECASEQGKFWEYADKLFENQSSLGDDLYARLASDLGLDKSSFDACLKSDKYLERIASDVQGGANAGVSGTPGSFVIDADGNAKVIKGALPFETVASVIDQAL